MPPATHLRWSDAASDGDVSNPLNYIDTATGVVPTSPIDTYTDCTVDNTVQTYTNHPGFSDLPTSLTNVHWIVVT
jgi:hypothetical protein